MTFLANLDIHSCTRLLVVAYSYGGLLKTELSANPCLKYNSGHLSVLKHQK